MKNFIEVSSNYMKETFQQESMMFTSNTEVIKSSCEFNLPPIGYVFEGIKFMVKGPSHPDYLDEL